MVSVSWGLKRGLWDPKRDPKNSGCLAGTQRMGGELAYAKLMVRSPVLRENLIRLAGVDFLTLGRELWVMISWLPLVLR